MANGLQGKGLHIKCMVWKVMLSSRLGKELAVLPISWGLIIPLAGQRPSDNKQKCVLKSQVSMISLKYLDFHPSLPAAVKDRRINLAWCHGILSHRSLTWSATQISVLLQPGQPSSIEGFSSLSAAGVQEMCFHSGLFSSDLFLVVSAATSQDAFGKENFGLFPLCFWELNTN